MPRGLAITILNSFSYPNNQITNNHQIPHTWRNNFCNNFEKVNNHSNSNFSYFNSSTNENLQQTKIVQAINRRGIINERWSRVKNRGQKFNREL